MTLGSPEADAQIISAIIAGVFTVSAGLFSVLLFTRRQRQEQTKDFLQWLTQFTVQFQTRESTSRIRIRLAERRGEVLAVLIAELEDDAFFDLPPDLLNHVPDPKLLIAEEGGIWVFLKDFTDYLYFFEQILAYGEELHAAGQRWQASRIVDHFGWFLRSLLTAWPALEGLEKDSPWRDGAAIFVRYLAVNRYHRLCEAALLLNDEQVAMRDLYPAVRNALLRQGGPVRTQPSLEEVRKKWRAILGASGEVRH